MPRDEGHEETEDILRKLEKRIAKEYKKAEEEVAKKLDEYLCKFEKKDEIKRKALENGLITQREYDEWRTGQIMVGKRWQEMRDSLAEDFTNANAIAKSIAYGYMPDVYALNHNYGTYQVEHGALVDTSYTLYDRQTVERLFDDNNTFYHGPGRKISDRINRGLDVAWNKKNVQSVMLQGILQGESIGKMATRLADSVGEQNRKATIRNVRTMTTGVQNAGRVDSYDRAKAMGINVQKQWMAALDGRTRHWHRELDGVSVDNDKPFVNEFGKIMYPGDPSADPANIYNCRCTLVANIKGFESDLSDLSLRNTNKLGDMTYEEWKAEKISTSDPITKQDDIAETMQRVYSNDYRRLSNSMIDLPNDPARLKGNGAGRLRIYKNIDERKLSYTKPVKYEKQPTEAEIRKFIQGKDETDGSCASLALAYIGNKNGYKVKDFKGGESQQFFASASTINRIALLPGVKAEIISGKDDYKLTKKLLKKAEEGKEYLLSTGLHASIIRKQNGKVEYLELQIEDQYGWKSLTSKALYDRFGCRNERTINGVRIKSSSTLIDIESTKNNSDFNGLLGYLNTYSKDE